MTNPVLKQLETKKAALKTAMMVTTSPFALIDAIAMPAADLTWRLWSKLKSAFQSSANIPPPNNVQVLAPEHPLAKLVHDMAAAQGATVTNICLCDDEKGFKNTVIYTHDSTHVSLTFKGNPLKEENGEALARGIIGHELGHLHADGHKDHEAYFPVRTAAATYRDFGTQASVLAGMKMHETEIISALSTLPEPYTAPPVEQVATTLLQVLPESPLLVGIAGTLFGLSVANAHLHRCFRHTMEFIADIRGAEISSPQAMIAVQNFFKENPRETSAEKEKPSLSSLLSHWERACTRAGSIALPSLSDTHPAMEARIDMLNRAFPDAAAGHSAPDMPAVFRSRREPAPVSPT